MFSFSWEFYCGNPAVEGGWEGNGSQLFFTFSFCLCMFVHDLAFLDTRNIRDYMWSNTN